MEPAEYAKMAALQDHHWWFAAKRRLVRGLLERHVRPAPSARFLEVGCGTGSMSRVLGPGALSVGLDLHPAALAHVRHARPVAGNVLDLPFADATFDVVGCFDLLYHRNVPRVERALAEIARVSRPGGWLLITDSACPSLYGAHDLAHHGARRFTRTGLRSALGSAGFAVEHDSHLHFLVFPAVWLSRVGGRALRGLVGRDDPPAGHSQLSPVPGPLNALLRGLYAIESGVAARVTLPFGVSVVAAARREPS